MKLTVVLAMLCGAFIVACSNGGSAPTAPVLEPEKAVQNVPRITQFATLTPVPTPTTQPTPTLPQIVRGKLDSAIEVKVFDREKVRHGTTLPIEPGDDVLPVKDH